MKSVNVPPNLSVVPCSCVIRGFIVVISLRWHMYTARIAISESSSDVKVLSSFPRIKSKTSLLYYVKAFSHGTLKACIEGTI